MFVPTAKLIARAWDTLTGKTRSYVDDSRIYARALVVIGNGIAQPGVEAERLVSPPADEIDRLRRENRQLTEQLTVVQGRCTELLEETRRLREMTKGEWK